MAAAAYASVGCGAERDPINRVQPQALKKSFFIGENFADPIDDPQFYMRNTVVDVPYGADQDGLFTATYAQPVNRVKWQITENELIARLAYELVEDAEHRGSRYTNDGQIVAAFRIEKQFDVINEYNPSTGEQFNVVVENTTDRPWYEREYIRVDWSKNLVTTGYQVDTLAQLGLYGGVEWESLALHVNDPNDVNAPVFATDEGYFDITVKAFAKPMMVNTRWGKYPSCFFAMLGYGHYFGVNPITTCAPAEATLRLSFKKIVDTDFEPSEWDGNRMQAFGVFYQERQGYERNYGLTDTKWHRFADKFNVWERSHLSQGEGEEEVFAQCATDVWRDEFGQPMKFKTYTDGTIVRDKDYTDEHNNFVSKGYPIPDPNGMPLAVTPLGADPNRGFMENGVADECSFYDGSDGSRCDVHSRRCTKPMYARTIKTIPWYYGPDSPPELFASTQNATQQWNYAIKAALQAGKKAEWDRLAGEKRSNGRWNVDNTPDGEPFPQNDLVTEEQLIAADAAAAAAGEAPPVPHVFVLCHNPVIEGDDPACGKVGLKARLGDLRYHSVNLINTPQIGSPWGIMVDGVDPVTGEKVAASINEWIPVLDIIAQGAVDTIRWLNGEINDNDVINGRYIEEWLRATDKGLTLLDPGVRSREEIERLSNAITARQVLQGGPSLPLSDLAQPGATAKLMQERGQYAAQVLGPSLDSTFEANRQRLIGSKFEAMLVNSKQLERVGVDPRQGGSGATGDMMAHASPLQGLDPELRRFKESLLAKAQKTNHFCMVHAEDTEGYVALARQAQRMFPLPDANDPNYAQLKHDRDKAIWTWIREQFHIAVIAHEMGHSVSLRHNFVSNFDALNFHPEYWQLRTNNGEEPECAPEWKVSAGFNNQVEFAQHVTPNSDGNTCVGPRWIDPITDRELNGNIWKWGGTTVMDYPGDMARETTGIGAYDRAAMRFVYADLVDVDVDATARNTDKYQTYLNRLDGFGGISGILDLAFSRPGGGGLGSRQRIGNGHYSSLHARFNLLGECTRPTDPSDPLTAKCKGTPMRHRKLWDMETYVNAWGRSTRWALDPDGRVRRPYMFGSDEYADGGNVPVFRSDAGADPYEQMMFLVNNYENRYIFTHFRKKNRGFSTNGVVARTEARVLDKMNASTKALALYYSSLPQSYLDLYTESSGGMLAHRLASAISLDHYARIMTRPEPGYYYFPRVEDMSGCVDDTPIQPLGMARGDSDRKCSSNSNSDAQADFVVPVGSGQGRFIHNEYDYDQGYFWSSYQTQVGSFYEKTSTVYYLMEAYNNFMQNSKDDYIDGRVRNLNYTSLYPEQMRKLFGDMMQDDHSKVGPYVTLPPNQFGREFNVNINFPSWSTAHIGDFSLPANSFTIDPLVGWEQQLPMLIYSYYFGGTTLTMDWVQMMRIFTPSGPEAVSYGDDNFIRYTDPNTGILYVARAYGTETVGGQVVERGIGARMLQYINELSQATFKHSVDGDGNVVWTRNSQLEPVCTDDSNAAGGAMSSACNAAATKVRLYSSNLDVMRELSDWMGIGPLNRQ